MVEFGIIRYFVDHPEDLDKASYIDLGFIKTNFPMTYKIFKSLSEHTNSIEALEASYLANYPVKEGERKELQDLLDKIKNTEYNSTIHDLLTAHKHKSVCNELAIIALDIADKGGNLEKIHEVYAKFEKQIQDEAELPISTDIDDLMLEEEHEGGLKWRLKCLNQSLGPLRKGNFGHIFARVETGKTAMWVSEVTYMMGQTDKPILIFFNEEGGKDVVWRMYSAVTGWTYLQCYSNPKAAKEKFMESGGGNIKFFDNPSTVSKAKIDALCEKYEPSLVIIDNMDKVKGFTADRKDLTLHEIYKWGRELAKTWCPVISVGQANAEADNTMWVHENHMADSKTGKPSELDFILGIGRTDKEGYENVRHLHLSKNKLRGDKNTLEELRHLKTDVLLVPHLSIYKDMS